MGGGSLAEISNSETSSDTFAFHLERGEVEAKGMQKSGRAGNNLQLINDAPGYVEFLSISVNRIVDGVGVQNECAGIPSVDIIVSSATSKICGQDVTASESKKYRARAQSEVRVGGDLRTEHDIWYGMGKGAYSVVFCSPLDFCMFSVALLSP